MKRIIRGIKKAMKSGTPATRKQGLNAKIHAELGPLDVRLGEVKERLSTHSEPPDEFWEYHKRGQHHRELHPTYAEFMDQHVALKGERKLVEARRKTLLARLSRVDSAGRKR